MFLPKMNASQVNRIKIPAFSGGFNPGNTGDSINDNQLTDCKNVWYRGGEVQTRPKFESLIGETNININYNNAQKVEAYCDGELFTFYISSFSGGSSGTGNLNCVGINAAGEVLTCYTDCIVKNDSYIAYKGKPGIISVNGIGVYVVSVNDNADNLNKAIIGEFSYINNVLGFKVEKMSDVAYEPKVIINGLGNLYYKLPRDSESELPKVTQLEGFNLLTDSYKSTFTTDSISNKFKLPVIPSDSAEVKIKIEVGSILSQKIVAESDDVKSKEGFVYKLDGKDSCCFTDARGVACDVLEFVISSSGDGISVNSYFVNGATSFWDTQGSLKRLRYYHQVQIKAKLDRVTGEISFPCVSKETWFGSHYIGTTPLACIDYEYDANLKEAIYEKYIETKVDDVTSRYPKFGTPCNEYNFVFPRCGDIHNNLEVTVKESGLGSNINKIINSKFSTTYGGTVGISHGNRTFLGGNENSVYFSDIDNPLYFPENCYFNVGTKAPITAFSKMNGYLLIFKKNSIFCSYETDVSESSTSDDYTNQSVVDITAQYMYKVKNISNKIGCDLTDTIQLCMNRLIWTNKSGEVFTITGLDNYSERNIFMIGDLVEKEIKETMNEANIRVFSADWQGYYMLFISSNTNTKVYLLDYNKNSYKYVASYTADNNNKFTWWKWELPIIKNVLSDEEDILFVGSKCNYRFDLDVFEDEFTSEEDCFIKTKFFDFDAPDFYKGIDKISIAFGNAVDADIDVEFLTERDEYKYHPNDIYVSGEKGKPSYIKVRNFYPKIKLCKQLGIKISSKGPMSFSNVIINYSLKGSVKNGI